MTQERRGGQGASASEVSRWRRDGCGLLTGSPHRSGARRHVGGRAGGRGVTPASCTARNATKGRLDPCAVIHCVSITHKAACYLLQKEGVSAQAHHARDSSQHTNKSGPPLGRSIYCFFQWAGAALVLAYSAICKWAHGGDGQATRCHLAPAHGHITYLASQSGKIREVASSQLGVSHVGLIHHYLERGAARDEGIG